MVDGDDRESAKRPEDKRMSQAGQRTLPNDLRLQQYLPDEIAYARRNRR